MKRKAQEEIVGFVAIVLLVAIVGVVFLGISVSNKEPVQKKSNDIRRLLDSSMVYTTECAFNYEPNYAFLNDLIEKCYSEPGQICTSGKKACIVLNETLKGMIENSWPGVGQGSKVIGYMFDAVYSVNVSGISTEKEIISFSKGNCSKSYVEGDNFFSASPGVITSSLRICY